MATVHPEDDGGIRPGDRVRARLGSLQTLGGIVREIVGSNARVEYDIFGQLTTAEIELGDLDRA